MAKRDGENLPWVEKYRPNELSELVSQGHITSTLMRLIEENKLPHLLFYGPPGTGKTSTILACARKMYGNSFSSMVLELNASDDRGIGVVREQIKDFANTKNIFNSGVKLIILDEADAMTSAAQAALRRVIEKYTKTTRFCILCNYLGKIIPAIQSRCTRFRFSPLRSDQVSERLYEIANKEKVEVDEDGMKGLVKLGQGDMRKCLNLMQSTHMAYPRITEEAVYSCAGKPLPAEIEQILLWLLNEEYEECFYKLSELQAKKGLAIQDIVSEIQPFVLRLDLDTKTQIDVLDKMGMIEERLANGCSEKLNLGALVGAFQLARESIAIAEQLTDK